MSKELTPLEAFERIKNTPTQDIYSPTVKYFHSDCCEIIETALKRLEKIETTTHGVLREDISKKLKALKIFTTKQIDIMGLRISNNANEYNRIIKLFGSNITQEEFDLLKEVM